VTCFYQQLHCFFHALVSESCEVYSVIFTNNPTYYCALQGKIHSNPNLVKKKKKKSEKTCPLFCYPTAGTNSDFLATYLWFWRTGSEIQSRILHLEHKHKHKLSNANIQVSSIKKDVAVKTIIPA
jgi:hypothetical protein